MTHENLRYRVRVIPKEGEPTYYYCATRSDVAVAARAYRNREHIRDALIEINPDCPHWRATPTL